MTKSWLPAVVGGQLITHTIAGHTRELRLRAVPDAEMYVWDCGAGPWCRCRLVRWALIDDAALATFIEWRIPHAPRGCRRVASACSRRVGRSRHKGPPTGVGWSSSRARQYPRSSATLSLSEGRPGPITMMSVTRHLAQDNLAMSTLEGSRKVSLWGGLTRPACRSPSAGQPLRQHTS